MKRKKPRDIVDRHVWRVAKLAALIAMRPNAPLIPPAAAVGVAIEILNEAQKQVDKDLEKGSEVTG